ncbi:hypothetical protein [uncultured Selenomonas sp.]|nr:hypothetical protein [uncultured Selenomonas sp.]
MRRLDDFSKALANLQQIRGKEPPFDAITQAQRRDGTLYHP